MEKLTALLISLGLLAPTTVLSPIGTMIQPPYTLPVVTKPNITFSQIPTMVNTSQPTVLGEQSTPPATVSPTNVAPSSTPTPTPTPLPTKKEAYTISFLGDSMIQTLGPDVPALRTTLKKLYPKTTFTFHNHGIGGKNINDGLTRLVKDYTYNGVNVPSIVSQNPDIVVVESFGYNPYTFEEGAMETHWLALAYIVDTIQQNLPEAKIIIFATIAPDSETFGDGVPAISLTPQEKIEKTNTIKDYLENTIKYAQSQNLPLANAYQPSMDDNGDGKDEYISDSDHIHYSELGKQFAAEKITEVIVSNKLLE